MQSKTKEFIHRIQKLTDECNEKDDKIELLTTQTGLLARDKDTYKNLCDIQMEKHAKLLEDNLLIPKRKEGSAESQKESQSQSPGKPNQVYDESTVFLQDEIRKLHFQLRHKDLIVQEFKRETEEFMKKKEGNLTERSSKLVSLLEKDHISQEGSKKWTEKMMDMIASKQRVDGSQTDAINQSVLFTASDLKHLVAKKNEQLQDFMTMYEQKLALEKEREELRKQLDNQLVKANINFEEETQKRVSEALTKAKV